VRIIVTIAVKYSGINAGTENRLSNLAAQPSERYNSGFCIGRARRGIQ
jgi:hypothetical protein